MQSDIQVPGAVTRRQSFTVVLLIELWERFGYYATQPILLLFLVQRLGFPDARANLLLGSFAALVWAAPGIGGYLGDQWLGTRRTMLAGATTLMVGYALLGVPANDAGLLYIGLAVVITGNGLFKANSANLVRRIFDGDDQRLDGAFTIYYMSVNVGSTVAILLSPWLKDRYGWHAAFSASAVGLAIGLLSYTLLRRRLAGIGNREDAQPVPWRRFAGLLLGVALFAAIIRVVLQHPTVARDSVWAAGVLVLGIWIWIYRRVEAAERAGLLIMYVLTGEVMLFFIFYQQTSTSLLLFSLRNVALACSIAGVTLFTWSPAQFQALDPIWIVLLTPVLVWLYDRAEAIGWHVPIAAKFAAGFACLAAAFLVWWLYAATSATPLVSSWSMVWAYGLFSAGELLTSGLGLAVVARYVPSRMSGFMMGAYYVAVGVAIYAGSMVANIAAIAPGGSATPHDTLLVYASLFRDLLMISTAGFLVCLTLLPWLAALDRRHESRAAAMVVP